MGNIRCANMAVLLLLALETFLPGALGTVVFNSGGGHDIGYAIDTGIEISDGGAPTEVNLLEGGSIQGDVMVVDNSVFNLAGGVVGSDVMGVVNARVNVLAGWIADEVECGGSSICMISGGVIGDHLAARGESRAFWAGGSIGSEVRVHDDAVLTITGRGFNYSYGAITDRTGVLTGILANGERIENPFAVYGNGAIVLVPEPATILLVVLGGLMMQKRKRF